MAKITKEMLISDILRIDEGVGAILMESGMHCIGCPSSVMESLEEASIVHNIDCKALVNKINGYLSK